MRKLTNLKSALLAATALAFARVTQAEVAFTAWTIPAADGLIAEAKAARTGGEWEIAVTAKNAAATNVTFKLVLAAEPGFAAARASAALATTATTGPVHSTRTTRTARGASTSIRTTCIGTTTTTAATVGPSGPSARRICPPQLAPKSSIQAQGGLMQAGWQAQKD